jgi:hypothetical protein
MNGFGGEGLAGTAATWSAAIVTIVVWSSLAGVERPFRLAQHLLAGLATGFLVVLAVRDVLVPRLLLPLVTSPATNLLLWPALALVVVIVASRWLPKTLVATPVALLVAGTAAFGLGGAVVGTLLPQMAGSAVSGGDAGSLAGQILALVITIVVLVSFIHGRPAGRTVTVASRVGRWVLVAGLGGWLGFLVVSRLALVVDRLGFLLGDWLGLVAR